MSKQCNFVVMPDVYDENDDDDKPYGYVDPAEINEIVNKNLQRVPFLSQEELVKFMAFLWYFNHDDELRNMFSSDFCVSLSNVHDTLSEVFLLDENYEAHYDLANSWADTCGIYNDYIYRQFGGCEKVRNVYYKNIVCEDYNRPLNFNDFMEICTKLRLPVLEVSIWFNPFDVPHESVGQCAYPDIHSYRSERMPSWSAREYDYENDRATCFYDVPEISTGEFNIFASNSSTSYKWHFLVLPFAVVVHSTICITD